MKKEIILIVGFMLAFSILLVACGNDKKISKSRILTTKVILTKKKKLK